LLVRSFIVYVQSLVECDSVIWSPQNVHDTEQIEQVQRRYTKRLLGLKMLSYIDKKSPLNIPSLELQHLHSDSIMCYKTVFCLVDVKSDDFFQFSTVVTT